MVDLHYKISGRGEPVIILHGLFGMLDNWQSIANRLQEHFMVILVDLRNHGRSPHTPTHAYAEMAEDVVHVMDQEGIPAAHIIGHSMGGKVAMQIAIDFPVRLNKLIVVDIGPKAYPAGHDDIFEALFAVNLSEIHYRADAEKILLERMSNYGVRQFLLKNLQRNADGTYSWRFNLAVLYQEYMKIRGEIGGETTNVPALFIRGGDSDYITDADWISINGKFPNAYLETIPHAGHWVHADQPEALYGVVKQFLLL
jgi:esterase